MATHDEMIEAGTMAPFGADALETYAYFDALAGKTASADEWRRKAALQEEFGLQEISMGRLLKNPPAPAPGTPTPVPTDVLVSNAIKLAVYDGGQWDSLSRVWPERMDRPSAARNSYMPMFNAYAQFKAKSNPPDVSWDTWVTAARRMVDDDVQGTHGLRRIVGMPPWPHKAGSWAEAATGAYRPQWRRFWNEVKRLGQTARMWDIRIWEFTGSHYPFHITVGVPYESGTIDMQKARDMAVAMDMFFDLGHEICGENVPYYDHNAGGSVASQQQKDGMLASAPRDHVKRVTMDRYVSKQDAADPERYRRDMEAIVALAREMKAEPGITEGSFFQDKVNSSGQLGGQDSAGAVECLKIVDGIMRREIKAGRNWGRLGIFNYCPTPEGHFAMFCQGARGTCTHPETPHARRLATTNVRFPDGQTYPTHCPRLLEASLPLWWGPLKSAA